MAHRLAWFYVHGVWPRYINHINFDGDDNHISNLRDCSASESQHHTRAQKNNKFGLKGVSHAPGGRKRAYRAVITVDGKQVYLGEFETPELAGAAYREAAIKLHDKFAQW